MGYSRIQFSFSFNCLDLLLQTLLQFHVGIYSFAGAILPEGNLNQIISFYLKNSLRNPLWKKANGTVPEFAWRKAS